MERRFRVYGHTKAERKLIQENGVYWNEDGTPITRNNKRLLLSDGGVEYWWDNSQIKELDDHHTQLASRIFLPGMFEDTGEEEDLSVLLEDY